MTLDAALSARTQLPPESGVPRQLQDCFAERRDIAAVEEPACGSFVEEFGGSGNPASDHGKPVLHRSHDRIRHPLAPGRRNVEIEGGEKVANVTALPQEYDPARRPNSHHQLLERGPVTTIGSDEKCAEVRLALAHLCHGPNEILIALVWP